MQLRMGSYLAAALVCCWSSGARADEFKTVSLPEIRRESLAYVETLRVPGQPFGTYIDNPGTNQKPSLYAACGVAIMRTIMGEELRKTLTPDQRQEWIQSINSFALPDGTYGPERRGHSAEHGNGMVISALGALGGQQRYPVRLYDAFDTPDKVGGWLEGVDWLKQWGGSHRFWGGMHCFSMSSRCTPEWRQTVFDWLDANLDPQSGWWRKGVAQVWPEPLGGGAHIWPIYQHHGHRFPYPERVIDSILENQKPDGRWLAFGSYMELDALYGLAYMRSLVPQYRTAEILEAARRHGRGLVQEWPGFIAHQPPVHVLLGAVGAFGLLQQLLPDTFVDEVRWTDIFSDPRLYQTAAVEVLNKADGKTNSPAFSAHEILTVMHRVNDWQIAHPTMKPDDRNWERGTWYAGVMAAYKATDDDQFLQQALKWGRQHQWQVGTEKAGANRLFCVETWAELALVTKDKAMIAPAIQWLNTPVENSPAGAKVWYKEGGARYADSLFGSAALAILAKATGEQKYLDELNAFFWDVHAELFDAKSGLFYRDKRFIGKTTAHGKKVFWSRGNGWVLAGTALILEYLPPSDPQRPRYVNLFKTMAAAVAQRQGADGLWRPNLDDPQDVPVPETSGTGFFCYSIAWGINHGLLDRETYLPVVQKAWRGLVQSVSPEGKVQWGQPVGDSPAAVRSELTHEYVTGAFLLAGSEMFRLAPADK
ncbi:MAG: glycoside hydrolase family 88/105 protein [Verrucomicrobiota bacterium]